MAPTLTHSYAPATNIYDICNPFQHPPQSSVKHFRFMSQVQLLPANIHVTNMNKSWHVKWKSLKFQGRSTKMITHQTLSLSLSLSLSHVISKLFVFVVLYEVWRVRAFTAVELKSYNAILAPSIYQKRLAAVEVKQKFFADLLQCTSIYRCAL